MEAGMKARTEMRKILTLCTIAVVAMGTRTGLAATAASLPAPGVYTVDPLHTFAYFGAMHHIVGLVRGRFDKVTGTITAAKDPAGCAVDISIDTATLNTQVTRRDEDLRGPDFFDVAHFPAMTYRGHGLRKGPDGTWIMDGSLTIRNVTRVVPLTFRFKGFFGDTPAGAPARAAFHATTAVKRGDFGMTRDNLMELIPNSKAPDVNIEIDVEANGSAPAK
jgi:polyisoprenoid-binding protein YceI